MELTAVDCVDVAVSPPLKCVEKCFLQRVAQYSGHRSTIQRFYWKICLKQSQKKVKIARSNE